MKYFLKGFFNFFKYKHNKFYEELLGELCAGFLLLIVFVMFTFYIIYNLI